MIPAVPRRSQPRLLAVLCLATVVLAACSRTPPGGGVAYLGPGGSVGAADGSSAGGADGSQPTGTGSVNAPGAGPGATGSSTASARAGASGGGGGGGGSAVKPIASAPGVTPTEIQIAFAGKLANCSESGNASETAAGGLNPKDASIIKADVEYVNKYVPLPGGRKLVLVGNTDYNGIKMIDHGGYYCPTKGQAAARFVVDSLRPFAVLGGIGSTAGPVFQQTIADGHVISIGFAFLNASEMSARWPYAIGIYGAGDRKMNMLADYVHVRVQGTQYKPTVGSPVARKYGYITYDDPAYQKLAQSAVAAFARYGINLPIYTIPSDTGQAAQAAPTVALRMKQDGVNSVVFGFPTEVTSITVLQGFDSAQYNPDLLVGLQSLAFLDTLMPHDQMIRASGIAAGGVAAMRDDISNYNNSIENADGYNQVWAQSSEYDGETVTNGSTEGYDWWSLLSALVAGLERSPVNFTAQDWAAGLAATTGSDLRCPVERFIGHDHPQASLTRWTRDAPDGLTGWTTVYWTNNKSQFGTPGYWESFDGYYDFFGVNDIPPQPTADTGSTAVPPIKQLPRIGLSPFKSCRSIGLQGDLYE